MRVITLRRLGGNRLVVFINQQLLMLQAAANGDEMRAWNIAHHRRAAATHTKTGIAGAAEGDGQKLQHNRKNRELGRKAPQP